MNNETDNKPVIGRPKGAVDTVKRKKRDNGLRVNEGDNARIVSFSTTVGMLPPIDHNDINAVTERVMEYFNLCIEYDMKPGVEGACLALGISRSTWGNWGRGQVRSPEYRELIERVRAILATILEQYMQNGKINPVVGIFWQKNHFGYSDKTEVVLSPNNPLGDTTDTEILKQKYLESTYGMVEGDENFPIGIEASDEE